MGVPVEDADSDGDSAPSSPQSFVSRSTLSVGSHDSERTKTEKLQPTVDAVLESLGPEIRPYDDQKLKKKYVRDDGQTFAANQCAPCGSGSSSPQNLVPLLQPTVDARVESHGPEIRPHNDRELKKKYVRDDGQTFSANQFPPRGSGSLSLQNLVPPSMSTVGSHDPKRTKKEKLQPTVDVMDESHGPEIRPHDDRELKKKYVRDDGQTFSANQFPPRGSGSSSLQNLVPPHSMSTVGSHNPEKTKKEELQPTVDAMDESHGSEIHPNYDRKLKKKYVLDDGQTFAANQSAPRDGTQYMPPMSHDSHLQCPAMYYQPNPFAYAYDRRISERDHKNDDLQDQLRKKDHIISELERKLDKEKAEVCAKDSSLREKEAELATCRRNLDHCETEKRQLQEMLRASQGSFIYEKEQLKMEVARCDAWHQQQFVMTIQPLLAELAARTDQFNRLLIDHQRQVERNRWLVQRHQHAMANARERSQTHPVESRIPQNDSQDVTQLGQNNGSQQDVNGGGSMNTNSGLLPNGNTDNATSFVSSGNASTQAALEVSQISAPSQTDQNLMRSDDAKCEHDTSVDGQALHLGHLDVHISPEKEPDSVISASAGEEQVLSQENDTNTILVCWGSTGLTSEIRLDTIGQNSDAKEQENVNLTDHGLQSKFAKVEEPSFAADASGSL